MNIAEIDLNLLRVFDALMRTRNVTLAGEIVGLSQPAVSFGLNKLRTLTADPLFVRTSRGMEPTPRASRMADPVRHVLEVVQRDIFLQDEFDARTSQRTFTLSLSDVGEMVFLPKLLRRLRTDAPGITLKSVSMPPARLEEAMAAGDVDLALGYFPDITKANFYQQHLFTHTFACLVRRDHPTIKTKLTMKQFLDVYHVVIRAEGRSQEIIERYLEEQKIVRKVGLSIPHFMSIPHLLPESDMLVTVPYSCAQSFARLGELRMLELPMKAPTFDLKQHWHARYHRDAANQWLRGIIYDCFSMGI
ncbi:LysR family transcriptional regulator [Noviherbaspirillum cavernae]|uniref:LysR family transcriptional regulator n=1 Tax=Noviherbaspirillum cavernae TaxID=2320862 RepID=A0A418WV99_9BURK|nr:LysR family transcriptional regulator [Noviherbaspirillum cavernae]RJF96573.1 LysR family transcriptional regulator [Noviherbaspirillum cavernae]